VSGVLGGRAPTVEDLPHLPLTQAVFDETLRLYPPAPGQPRETLAEDEIAGFAIPRKAMVMVYQWVTHRRPDLWDEPDQFRPERFFPENAAGRPKFAYYPFGGGPRVCIGNTFALIEGPLLLAALVQRYRLELVPGQSIEPDTTFTLRPKGAVRMRLHKR
jgi:cytochrome P450